MEKKNLSQKLNYILKELNMNRKQFIEACNKVNISISKPTILNAINGKSKGLPKLETIDTIIKVCKNSNNEKLQKISYDYLMNESIDNINNENISIHYKTGLSDKAIEILYKNYHSESYVLSYLIENIHYNFWQYQDFLIIINKLQGLLVELDELHNSEFKNESLFNLKDLYYSFKKEQLNELKREKNKNEYKKYILKELNYPTIFNDKQSTEELEGCLLQLYSDISVDLRQVFYEFLKTGQISNKNSDKYTNNDLEKFKIYYEEKCKYDCNSYFDKYINKIYEIHECYISVFLIEFLRENFKGQYRYIKDREKYLKKIKLYKDYGLKIDYESYCDFHEEMKKFANSLEVLNKYLRLAISEYMSEYYNKMLIDNIKKGLYNDKRTKTK